MNPYLGPRRAVLLIWLGAIAAAAGYFLVAIYLLSGRVGFPLDDGWIHLQFARNLAASLGLSYNGGEPVTGSTAPLWTAILSLGYLLPGGGLLWARVAGVSLYALCGWATWRLGRALGLSAGPALGGSVLTLATSWMIWASLSAMEIPLFSLLTVLGVALHVEERRHKGRPPLSLGLFGLSVLARPEGLLLLVFALIDRLALWPGRSEDSGARRRWADAAYGVGIAALIVVPTLLFYRVAGGSALPTTFSAKAGGLHRWLPSLDYMRVVVGLLFLAQPVPTLLAGGGAVTLLRRWRTDEGVGLLALLWPLGFPMAYSLLSPPSPNLMLGNFGRYMFPLFPFVVVLAMLTLQPLLRSIWERAHSPVARHAAIALLVVLVALPTLFVTARGALRFTRHIANVNDGDVGAALWLRPRLSPQAVLAVNDIGALKYLLPNHVIDLAGILDPRLVTMEHQSQRRTGDWQDGVRQYLEQTRPDYAVVFPSWYPDLVGPGKLLQPIHVLRIPDNEALGGDVVAICRTPWTRFPLAEPHAR